MLTQLDLAVFLAAILLVIVTSFVTQVVMLRRLRRLAHALGVLVIQESLKIRRAQG